MTRLLARGQSIGGVPTSRVWIAVTWLALAAGFTVAAPINETLAAEPAGGAKSAFRFPLHKEPKTVPDLRFVDGEARPLALSNFRGKVVLLNIWATWCPPCREEMPSLDRLQAKLEGPSFEVVALSIDQGGVFVVKAFFEELRIKALRVYLDEASKATPDLGIFGLPATLLIDRQGREIGRLVGPAKWDSPEAVSLIRRHMDAQ